MKQPNFYKIVEKYSDLSIYGFNSIIKDYAHFPKWLPLPAHMEHGWTALGGPLPSDLSVRKPLMLVFSKRRKTAWRSNSERPVEIMGSPFEHYRRLNKIEKKPTAKGTVVFPCHSNSDLKVLFDVKKYCQQLSKLPSEFKPITICLFWFDFVDEKANIYRDAGFEVVTAGSKLNDSLEFVKNYYEILSNHKYATSNEVGSYTFYAVEMGIPFFLLGDLPLMAMKEGKNDVNVPKQYKITDFDLGKYTTALFSTGHIKSITGEQSKFIRDENGLDDCTGSKELNDLLWKYFWQRGFFMRTPAYWLINIARILRDSLRKK